MKYNISNPMTGQQKVLDIDDDKINRHFSDRRMGSDVDGEVLAPEFKGYTLRITGGNDRQGFTMKQGILVNGRVRILMKGRTTLYRPRRTGERKRKSVRGCICGQDLAVIALKILEKGEGEIKGLTDVPGTRRLGPKRASNIAQLFALRRGKDDVRKKVIRRPIVKKEEGKDDKTYYKSVKIQRLVTERRVRRKVVHKRMLKERWTRTKEAHVSYEKLLSKYLKDKKAADKSLKKQEMAEKTKTTAPAPTPAKAPVAPKKAEAATKKPATKTEKKK